MEKQGQHPQDISVHSVLERSGGASIVVQDPASPTVGPRSCCSAPEQGERFLSPAG